MAFGRTKTAPDESSPPSLIASAARITVAEAAWPTYRFTDETWQAEAWRFYDTVPEMNYAAEYIGAAVSLVRLVIKDVDEHGVPQEETKDPEVAAIAETIFGGPKKKVEVLRAIAASLTVAGECYLVGRAAKPGYGDRWTVVAPSRVRRYAGKVRINFGANSWEELNPNRDVIMRIWTQHPADPWLCTSPAKGLLLTCEQLTRLRLYLNSQLNSRIANANIYPLPSNLEFPGNEADGVPEGAPGVAQEIYESMTSNLNGQGTAAQFAPIIFEVPPEILPLLLKEPIRLGDTPLSEEAIKLRAELVQDFSRGMNVPAEVFAGMGQGNHWTVYWSSEEFITKTVAPIASRICEAITSAYLYGALKTLGKDPSRYTFDYDVSPLSNTADRLNDALNMYEKGLISADAARRAANFVLADAPSAEEEQKRFIRTIVERNPQLIELPGIRDFLDIDIPELAPAPAPMETSATPPVPPAPDKSIMPPKTGDKPLESESTATADSINASIAGQPILDIANAAVVAALTAAGKKMLTPQNRGRVPRVNPWELHTHLRAGDEEACASLMATAWDTAPALFEDRQDEWERLRLPLYKYTQALMLGQVKHSRSLLAAYLGGQGL